MGYKTCYNCVLFCSGTLPVITYTLVKINDTSLFVCNATGLPSPRVTVYKVIGGNKHVVLSNQTPISDDTGLRSYYCVAQNDFGVSFSEQVDIQGMLLNIVMALVILRKKCRWLYNFRLLVRNVQSKTSSRYCVLK